MVGYRGGGREGEHEQKQLAEEKGGDETREEEEEMEEDEADKEEEKEEEEKEEKEEEEKKEAEESHHAAVRLSGCGHVAHASCLASLVRHKIAGGLRRHLCALSSLPAALGPLSLSPDSSRRLPLSFLLPFF